MEQLEARIGYYFKNKELLSEALTHSSYANENLFGKRSNERLEFLGDSVLSVIVSEYLFLRFNGLTEGELTKMRASLVCEGSLCSFARKIGMGDFILFGRGERQSGGKNRPSILADAFEALVASIYLDGGLEQAARFVSEFIESGDGAKTDLLDSKTVLQELVQKNEQSVNYVLVAEDGPDHLKVFTTDVFIDGVLMGTGTGRSKKISEQSAAKQALEQMDSVYD
ncbi:MAG: ribonuclease III [Oscillospiraceae bacterium]|nr:ribonuclease III [Oscillospiraceae bacterium]